MPLWLGYVAAATAGAWLWDRFTGAAEDAGDALEKGSGGVLKIAAVAGVAYVGYEAWKRGAFK